MITERQDIRVHKLYIKLNTSFKIMKEVQKEYHTLKDGKPILRNDDIDLDAYLMKQYKRV